jgi:3-hydroxymyristoyl/3-hydroxydecanoyl-(acyl carrier protein) dehydratase
MIDTGLQIIGFYMAALGFTLRKDGWRFEPVRNEPFEFRCQAQLTPESKEIIYEIYIREVISGPEPVVHADVLGIIDGVKGILGQNVGVRLAPGWAVDRLKTPIEFVSDSKHAAIVYGRRVDPSWIYQTSLGRPALLSDRYLRFDGAMRIARLPAPPYLLMSRVLSVHAEEESFKLPATIESEYDIPANAWYFQGSQKQRMPLCVLMEIALQPCGWLSNHYAFSTKEEVELFYRNLDGTMELFEPITPADEVIRLQVKATSISRVSGMVLLAFEVVGTVKERTVLKMSTGFGYFSEAALAAQVGVNPAAADLEILNRPSNLDWALKRSSGADQGLQSKSSLLPTGMLGILDSITGFWPGDGASGLGFIRAEKEIDPGEWFFKAHFYTDPVMPGTLGIQSIIELVEFYMLHTGLDEGLAAPHFETVTDGQRLKWKYRGQVLPNRKHMVVTAEVLAVKREQHSVTVTASASLWIDGVCIYQIASISVRLVSDSQSPLTSYRKAIHLSPGKDPWLLDHRPNLITPVVPMMTVMDTMACAVHEMNPERVVTAVHGVTLTRWLVADTSLVLRVLSECDGQRYATRMELATSKVPDGFNWEQVAGCSVETAETYPDPPPEFSPLQNAHTVPVVYETQEGFHGPSFHLSRSLRYGDRGASAILDAGGGAVPVGVLHPALLDNLYHSVPLHAVDTWLPEVKPGFLSLPSRIDSLGLYATTPLSGPVRCEVRFDDYEAGSRFHSMRAQFLVEDHVWAEIRLTNFLIDASLLMSVKPRLRWDYLRYGKFVPNIPFSERTPGLTVLSYKQLTSLDWIPGSVARFYDIQGDPSRVARVSAIKDHIAARAEVNPAFIGISEDLNSATPDNQPYTRYSVELKSEKLLISVTDAANPTLDVSKATAFWRDHFLASPSDSEEMFFSNLCEQFLDKIQLQDHAALQDLQGRPVIYLANRETAIEQFFLAALLPPVTGTPLQLVFPSQPASIFLRALQAGLGAWTGDRNPEANALVLAGPEFSEAAADRLRSLLHVERMSLLLPWSNRLDASATGDARRGMENLLELAASSNTPIVPLRIFGSPLTAQDQETPDLPSGLGRLQIWLGAPLLPDELSSICPTERLSHLSQAILTLGPSQEQPIAGDRQFASNVRQRMSEQGVAETIAVLLECGLPIG